MIEGESLRLEFTKKKEHIEQSIALGSRMAKLMTDLSLDVSTDHVENEKVEDDNNCP
jgi:hypothetical protein